MPRGHNDGSPDADFPAVWLSLLPREQIPGPTTRNAIPWSRSIAPSNHTPGRKLVEGWQDRTPDGFGFSLKVPQVIIHEKLLADCRKELTTFLTAARVLEGKLHCCLLQFGYFNKKAFASLDVFLARLDPFLAEWPKDVPVAVELRNKTWLTPKLVECLRTYGAVWALGD
jgi:uncharacterized protein YecE (DUF72 family)